MLYLPSFRRSAHQDDNPPPAFTFRPYTPDPIPSPAPIHNLDSDHPTNATPDDNGTTFIPPYSSPHLTPAAPKPQQTTFARVAQNAHYALLALSLLTVAIAITVVGLAAATLHQYHHAQSGPHHLHRLPTNLDTAPTVAVLGSGALVAILNATFLVVAILQVVRDLVFFFPVILLHLYPSSSLSPNPPPARPHLSQIQFPTPTPTTSPPPPAPSSPHTHPPSNLTTTQHPDPQPLTKQHHNEHNHPAPNPPNNPNNPPLHPLRPNLLPPPRLHPPSVHHHLVRPSPLRPRRGPRPYPNLVRAPCFVGCLVAGRGERGGGRTAGVGVPVWWECRGQDLWRGEGDGGVGCCVACGVCFGGCGGWGGGLGWEEGERGGREGAGW